MTPLKKVRYALFGAPGVAATQTLSAATAPQWRGWVRHGVAGTLLVALAACADVSVDSDAPGEKPDAEVKANNTPCPNNLGLNQRPAAPAAYGALPVYNDALNAHQDLAQPGFQVHMARHHIIPWNELRDFYNALARGGDLQRLRSAIRAFADGSGAWVGLAGIAGYWNQMSIPPAGLNAQRMAAYRVGLGAFRIADQIANGRIVHDANAARAQDQDDFAQFYAWMPWNLFIGPVPELRGADPGEAFEERAEVVVGQQRFDQIRNVRDLMALYVSAGTLTQAQWSTLNGLLAALMRGRTQPHEVNPAHWRRDANGRYWLNDPPP